jgi:hypothetical protein
MSDLTPWPNNLFFFISLFNCFCKVAIFFGD